MLQRVSRQRRLEIMANAVEEISHCAARVISIGDSSVPERENNLLRFPFRRSSVGTFIRQQPLTSSGSSSVDSSRGSKTSNTAPRLDYRSMVSVEDMPDLFVPVSRMYFTCIITTYHSLFYVFSEWTFGFLLTLAACPIFIRNRIILENYSTCFISEFYF